MILRLAGALALAVVCWSLAHHEVAQRYLITDTGLYEQYGDATARGAVPYRDFKLEYPPGALPVFVLPSLGHEGDRAAYDRWFDREMALCWLLVVVAVALVTTGLVPLAIVAATPVLLGPVVLSRFDAWPVALAAFALAAFVRRWLAASAVLLGAAIAAKLWPFVLLPLLARRAGLRFAAGAVAVAAAVFIPFAVLAPGGLWHSFHEQLARPLQLESLGGALLVAAHHAFGTNLGVVTSYGSQNPAGPGTHVLAILLTAALAAALVAIWLWGRDLIPAAAACVAALLAFGKVFSPQFMLWLAPFAALVPGLATSTLLVSALLLTQSWFPRHYWDLASGLHARESWELFTRDLTVVALFAVTAWRARAASSSRPVPAASRADPPAVTSSGS